MILLVLPGGLASVVFGVRDRVLKMVARRRGIDMTASADGTPSRTGSRPGADREARGGAGRGAAARAPASRSSYGPMQVLFGVDLDVADGEIVALLGTNGAGKSTMLKAVAGLV